MSKLKIMSILILSVFACSSVVLGQKHSSIKYKSTGKADTSLSYDKKIKKTSSKEDLTQNNSFSQNNTGNQAAADSAKAASNLLMLKKIVNGIKNTEKNDLGINGLIVDETESKIGHDFYDAFYSEWQAPKIMTDYTITISEKPLPQLGTQITILINDSPVFKRFVQPRYEIIEELARQGAATAYSYLENYTEIQKQLQGEDLKGTGIY